MEEHIEYYTDLIAHLNEQINQENIKLFEFESMLLKEQRTLSEYSFFRRLFSNNKKFILDLQKLVYRSTTTIENYRKQIEDNKEKFVSFGTQKMIEESAELKNLQMQISNCVDISTNIKHMTELMQTSQAEASSGLSYFNHSKSQNFKSQKKPYFEKCFTYFLSSINRVNDLKRYMGLDGFVGTDTANNSFTKNSMQLIDDILGYDTIFNSHIIERMRATTSNPHIDLLEHRIDVMERIDRNLELLILSFQREQTNIQSEYSDLVLKKDEIENNYRVLFLNKIKKTNGLAIF